MFSLNDFGEIIEKMSEQKPFDYENVNIQQKDYTSPSQSERKSLRQMFNDMRDDVDYFVRCTETFIKKHEQKPQRMISAEAKEALYDKPTEKVEEHLKDECALSQHLKELNKT